MEGGVWESLYEANEMIISIPSLVGQDVGGRVVVERAYMKLTKWLFLSPLYSSRQEVGGRVVVETWESLYEANEMIYIRFDRQIVPFHVIYCLGINWWVGGWIFLPTTGVHQKKNPSLIFYFLRLKKHHTAFYVHI